MNISFGTKLNIDNSFYTKLRFSDKDEIINKTKFFLDRPKISQLIPEDEITLSAKKYLKGDCVQIGYGEDIIEIANSRGGVSPNSVAHQLLYVTCLKNNKNPKRPTMIKILETLSAIYKEKFGN